MAADWTWATWVSRSVAGLISVQLNSGRASTQHDLNDNDNLFEVCACFGWTVGCSDSDEPAPNEDKREQRTSNIDIYNLP